MENIRKHPLRYNLEKAATYFWHINTIYNLLKYETKVATFFSMSSDITDIIVCLIQVKQIHAQLPTDWTQALHWHIT